MKTLFAVLSIVLFSQLALADSFYETRNGKNYLCRQVSEVTPLPSCTEDCQHFDTFENVCKYATSCEYSSECLTEKVCEVFDRNEGTCKTEKSTLTCGSDAGTLISCVERCQHYDSFNQACFYQTSCTRNGSCLVAKSCSRWDSFNNVCLSEKTVTTCR